MTFSNIMILLFFFLPSLIFSSYFEVPKLPGQDFELESKQYAGYLNVSKNHRLFYWLAESENNKSTDPLVFWFNGGPGCSSLAGLFSFNGPMKLNSDAQTLRKNEFSWTKFASVVYLETPAPTGFSYSIDDQISENDVESTTDNYEALKLFFQDFPQYLKREVFLTGISYAGTFIPMLAERILSKNELPINLKGLAIGNGMFSDNLSSKTSYVYAYTHGLIDEDIYHETIKGCCGQTTFDKCDTSNKQNKDCETINKHSQMYNGINSYNIYEKCKDTNWMNKIMSSRYEAPIKPCDSESADLDIYLSRQDVRESLRIPSNIEKWTHCYTNPYYDFCKYDMDEYMKTILKHNVTTLLYHGEADLVCNFMMGQQFAARIHTEKERTRAVNFMVNNVAAGYRTRYENLIFLTIRNAGHTLSLTHPKLDFEMHRAFFNGEEVQNLTTD